ncbi:Uncharacterised protein [Bordetella pertussis]|nr:Uncharacterised protein [Bordetella pertussis]
MLTAGARAGGRDAAGQPAGQLVGRGIGGLAQGLHAAGGILGGGRPWCDRRSTRRWRTSSAGALAQRERA